MARVAAKVLKAVATSAIQTVGLEDVTDLCMDGMATRWPAVVCAKAITRAAAEELALLPQHLRTIEAACKAAAKRLGSDPLVGRQD
jgi:hypothetical protein